MIGERAETRALHALDTDACIKLAQDLVRVPSVTGNERAVQDLVALTLEEAGLEVDRFEADVSRLKAHPRFPGMEVERTEAVLVAGLLGQTGERSLILNGHVDVVPVGDRQAWHASPWSAHIQAGRLYGRGACDMKAGLAVGISAAAALTRATADGRLHLLKRPEIPILRLHLPRHAGTADHSRAIARDPA